MREFALCKELTLKLAKDIGATPLSFVKVSLTHSDLLTNIILNVADEDGTVRKIPIWYGEAAGEFGITCGLLAGLDSDPNKLEFACILGLKDSTGELTDDFRLSFHYDWTNEEDPGTIVMRAGEKWIPISLAQRLQLAIGFEMMVQDGVVWQPSANIPKELQADLTAIIEVD